MNGNESAPCIFPLRPTERTYVERRLMARLRFYAEYEYAVREWYRNGDGRRVSEGGKGYSFPCCIHGSSAWTDYDNICIGCEMGDSYWDFNREAISASSEARWAKSVSDRRCERAVPLLMESGPDALPTEVRDGLMEWALAPLNKF